MPTWPPVARRRALHAHIFGEYLDVSLVLI
jgi:hypothetical protein